MEEVKGIKKGKPSSKVSLSTAKRWLQSRSDRHQSPHQQGSLTVRQLNLAVRPS